MSALHKRLRLTAAMMALGVGAGSVQATDLPQNLGYGAEKLVESSVLMRNGAFRGQTYNGFATQAAADYAAQAITEPSTGRYLVDILPRYTDVDSLAAAIKAKIPSFKLQAVDRSYRGTGILEGYVDLNEMGALSQVKGVRSVFLGLKPDVNRSFATNSAPGAQPAVVPGGQLRKLGGAFDQGVVQHRVDRINTFYNPSAPVNWDGLGVSVGVMSDSFDTRAAAPHAADGVTSFDLPGAPTNPVNTTPVTVIHEEPAAGTDEGRAMAEIVYKMAPKSRIAYATGAVGEVQFGNDIRALAALPGFTYPPATQQGFKADVIVDDISYGGEPFYGETIIGNAIDEVTAAGVSYFSSAGNNIGINAYESTLRWVPNGTGLNAASNSALAGTNIDLTGVPSNLYAGGFHNFNPAGLDVAQLVNMPSTPTPGSTEMQWDDPYDQHDIVLNQPPIYSTTGNSTGGSITTFDQNSTPPLPVFTAGTQYVIAETATSGDFDGIVTVVDPNGATVVSQDTGTDETVSFFATVSGQYKITIAPFSTTSGNYSLVINTGQGGVSVTTDLNLLVFRADTGAYIAARSLTTNNLQNNRPVELGTIVAPTGQTQVQFLITRSNVPTANQVRPSRVRWSTRGNGAGGIGPAEYFTYNATTTKGHATAKGCNGTAAYSVFRPNLPETFTSPGPATILFDKDANRLTTPDFREVPRIAAADAANTSFFSSDSTADLDTTQNFSGTSAAAPHAAAIAALVIQSRGGPGSISPSQLRSVLQQSTFPHDLDPSQSNGTAIASNGGVVNITIDSDGDNNALTGANDVNSFKVSYSGPGALSSLVFNPGGTSATAGHVTGGNNGYSDDVGSNPATVTYFENSFPGLLFIPATRGFALGTLSGLTAADVTAPLNAAPFTGFSNLAPAPANGTSQFFTMALGFPTGAFTSGKVLRFTVGRATAHSATVNTAGGVGPTGGGISIQTLADLFGGGVFLPSGTVVQNGMAFSGTTTGGGTFNGTIQNKIGQGFSPVDGYGFIDAAAAVGFTGAPLQATGAAAPGTQGVGGSALMTVKVFPATVPPSTGVAVIANLSAIGGSSTQTMFDNGTNGDVTAGDGIYSFNAVVASGTTSGAKNMPVTVSDIQTRTATASLSLTVQASTLPSGNGLATPNSVVAGGTSLLTVAVAGGSFPASSGLAVSANLSTIGGASNQAFYDDGTHGDVTANDGVYSVSVTVGAATPAGLKTFTATIRDDQNRSGFAGISLNVPSPGAPSGIGVASPTVVTPGTSSVLAVAVTPGSNPASTGLAVTVNLTALGGGAAQSFFDDGSNGDQVAGDNIFTYTLAIPANQPNGIVALPATISDAQSRSSTATINVDVRVDAAFKDGFEDP